MDREADNQFAVLEVRRAGGGEYLLGVTGYGRQPGYVLERSL